MSYTVRTCQSCNKDFKSLIGKHEPYCDPCENRIARTRTKLSDVHDTKLWYELGEGAFLKRRLIESESGAGR